MSRDFKDKSLPLDKVIELGSIDRWLRDIAKMVPKPADPGNSFSQERDLHSVIPGYEVTALDPNMHVLPFASRDLITDSDIGRMKGFQSLMATASQKNVRVDIASINGDAIEINFEPDEPFSRSRAFGASYANVLPAIFGGPAMVMKK